MAGDPSVSRMRQFVSYLWQFYLPRLGFMDPSISPGWGVKEAFVDRLFGGFAQLEVAPPDGCYRVAVGAVALIALAVVGVVARRRALARRPESRSSARCRRRLPARAPRAAFRSLLDARPGHHRPLPAAADAALRRRDRARGLLAAAAVAVPARLVLVGLTVLQLAALALVFERFYA